MKYAGAPAGGADIAADAPLVEKQVPVEIDGRRYDVKLWVPETLGAPVPTRAKRSASSTSGGSSSSGGNGEITAPMQGTIVGVKVAVGDTVAAGDDLVVLEAMKMENAITADIDGTVAEIAVAEGDGVGAGDLLVRVSP